MTAARAKPETAAGLVTCDYYDRGFRCVGSPCDRVFVTCAMPKEAP